MERGPEYSLRLNLNANRGRDYSLGPRLNDWEQPSLVLDGSSHAEDGRGPVVNSDAKIGQRAASGDELLTNFLVPEIKLQAITWAEPVI